MIVCQCAGVTDSMIVRVIEQGAATVADVTRVTGAGRCCAPCRQEIANLLSASRLAPGTLGVSAEQPSLAHAAL